MTDTEILDYIEAYLRRANTGGPSTKSVKLACESVLPQIGGHQRFPMYRFGGGRWHLSLRDTVEDHARRNPR